MTGISHFTIGCATGFSVSFATVSDVWQQVVLTLAGGVSALIPDLDTNGKLTNKITISHKLFQYIVALLAIIIGAYSFFLDDLIYQVSGIALSVILLIAASKISQKTMLILTGLLFFVIGMESNLVWLMLFGAFVVLAAVTPHRSFTHSLLGLTFFGYITYLFVGFIPENGLFITIMLGYISHLIADMRFIPTNKQGIKLFQPFSQFEI